MKNLLITGASGFIGSNVLNALKHKDYEVHAVYQHHVPSHSGAVTWHKANLLSDLEIRELFSNVRPTHLVHLAWCTAQGSYWTDKANLDWLVSGINIARAFVGHGGERAVFAGTSAEYSWDVVGPLDERNTPLQPLKLYGGAKLGLYWTLMRLFEQENLGFAWARFFNPFGPNEDPKRLIPKTCFRLLTGETLSFDAARSLRDFLHVEDVGSAMVSVLESNVFGPVNIGSGSAISVREVIETIAEIYNKTEQIQFAEDLSPATTPDSVVADTTILNSDCNWKPLISFRDRMLETRTWWKQQHK